MDHGHTDSEFSVEDLVSELRELDDAELEGARGGSDISIVRPQLFA